MTISTELKESVANLIAEQIHNGLLKQSFFDWYNTGEWDTYLAENFGDEEVKKVILKQIKSLFKLN